MQLPHTFMPEMSIAALGKKLKVALDRNESLHPHKGHLNFTAYDLLVNPLHLLCNIFVIQVTLRSVKLETYLARSGEMDLRIEKKRILASFNMSFLFLMLQEQNVLR